MCVGSEFQVDGAEQNAREVKLLVMPEGLARRFVLEERKALDGRYLTIILRIKLQTLKGCLNNVVSLFLA